MVAYSQLLCQRTVVTSPHNTFFSPLLLLLFCLSLLQPHAFLFNYPYAQILPKQSQQRFLLAAHTCCPLFPSQPQPPWGGLSSVLGSVSVQAAETWQEKANPSDTEVVTCFPQGCREQGGGGGQHPPLGELQHSPVCAAWLHLILFALVPNTYLLKEVCLAHPQFKLRLAISCHPGAALGFDH